MEQGVPATASFADSGLDYALQTLCRFLGWPLGHAVLFKPRPVAWSGPSWWCDTDPDRHRAFVEDTVIREDKPEPGLWSTAFDAGRAVCFPDVADQPTFMRREPALDCGLVSMVIIPVMGLDGGVEGLLEFFTHDRIDLDEAFLSELTKVGSHLGSLVAGQRAALELRQSEEQLLRAQELASVGSWTRVIDDGEARWTPEMHRIFEVEWTGGEVPLQRFLDAIHPDDRDAVTACTTAIVQELKPYVIDFRIVLPSGTVRDIHARGDILEHEPGEPIRIGGFVQDVTEMRNLELEHRQTRGSFEDQQDVLRRIARRDPLDSILDAVCRIVEGHIPGSFCTVMVVDADAGVLRMEASPSLPRGFTEAIDGIPTREGMGACGTSAARRAPVIVHDALVDPLLEPYRKVAVDFGIGAVWSHPLVSGVGETIGTFAVYREQAHSPDEVEIGAVMVAGRLAALAIEREQAELALTHAARIDPLTGLPNRTHFLRLLGEAVQLGAPTTVMFFDLDRFKWVNDSLGHHAGDRVLVELVSRLRRELDPATTVARFGGDEFTVMVPAAPGAQTRAAVLAIERSVADPFLLDGGEFFLTVSIGSATNDAHNDAAALIRDADTAMYAAKESGRAQHVAFDETMRASSLARISLEADLRRAIAGDELLLHYQPVFDLDSGELTGAEALVRWQHPTRGLMGPYDFIPLAEETGLIVSLGQRVLEMAVRDTAAWHRAGSAARCMVNISVVQLADPALVDHIFELLAASHLPPEMLLVEVTESAVMEHVEAANEALRSLVDRGVQVLIDDFGTGYSSIARIEHLPVMGIKVDRGFTESLGVTKRGEGLFEAIISLARALSLYVVVEGISSQDLLERVRSFGCTFGQGFHLAMPMPLEELRARLGV